MAAIILSDCAARSGSADEAEKWLERAIELSPSNWVAYFLLGERKLHEGQTELAGDLLTKASEIGITLTLLPLDMNTIKEKLERYLAELKCAPACVRT
jgi:tetratricopeptide (TPR) repeat protein